MQTSLLILTQTSKSGGIMWPLAQLMGWIMNGIYVFLDHCFHVQNVAFTVVLFTILMYAVMFPLSYRQQKFNVISSIMNPEIQYIQNKYKGTTDPVTLKKMQEEIRVVYKKYGVHASGSCLMMLLEFAILFPLYSVISNVPNYISNVRNIFNNAVSGIMGTNGYKDIINTFIEKAGKENSSINGITLNFEGKAESANSLTALLYRLTDKDWGSLKDFFPSLSDVFDTTQHTINNTTDFLGVNIIYSPRNLLTFGIEAGVVIMLVMAILIPVLSVGLQMLNMKLVPKQQQQIAENPLAKQMSVITYCMMAYSFVLAFCLPVGVGIYWITGSAIRCVEQLFFNAVRPKIAARSQVIADASWEAIRAEEILMTEDYAQGKKEGITAGNAEVGNSFCECDSTNQVDEPVEPVIDYNEVSKNGSDQTDVDGNKEESATK